MLLNYKSKKMYFLDNNFHVKTNKTIVYTLSALQPDLRNYLSPFSDPAVYLKAALKDGYIPHKDDLFLIHGPGGVGKSSLIDMFLGKQRDLARVSTALTKESLHVCPVRDVSTSTFTEKWEEVDLDRQARMVAHTSRHLLSGKGIRKIQIDENETIDDTEVQPGDHKVIRSEPFLTVTTSSLSAGTMQESESISRSQTKPSSGSSGKILRSKFLFRLWRKIRRKPPKEIIPCHLVAMLEDDSDNIEGILGVIEKDIHKLMKKSDVDKELVLYYSIRVVDSGGQPQFHEVVSIVLPAVTGIVSVFRLSEHLAVHGEVVFYKDGVQANDMYKSYLTNEQVIRHDLLAIQSETCQSSIDEMPNLAFVGTFLDLQDACPDETPDQKDEKLHCMITEILPEEMQHCVISYGGSLRQVTFRLNARIPSDKDYETAGRLKEALMSQSRVKARNLPLKWCSYEVVIAKLMQQLKRQILSLQECEYIGFRLGFDPLSLKACLHYLRKFHIITFYDVLPNVVFGSCQVILDKITELVTLSLELKNGNRASVGVERKFHQQGILSLQILTPMSAPSTTTGSTSHQRIY